MSMNERSLTPGALYRAVLLAFGLVVLMQVFPQVAGLVLLLVLVAVIAVPIARVATWLKGHGVPRAVGAPLTLLAALAVLGGIVALLVPTFIAEARQLIDALPRIVDELRHDLSRTTGTSPSKAGHNIQGYVDGYTRHPDRLLAPASSIGAGIAGAITALIVVLLTAVYAAIHPRPLVDGVLRLVPVSGRPSAVRIMSRLAESYLGWLRGLAVGMLVLWVITYAGLVAVGLPYAVVFATVTALAMVVPYFGALFSMIPPVVLALTISPAKALLVTGIYLIAHQIEGNLIEPIVMARAVKLHPALVVVGVIAVERLFGFAGLLVAVPVIVTAKILVEELWVARLERREAAARESQPLPRVRFSSGAR
jgi:predicted PurR-regulated permease PerM